MDKKESQKILTSLSWTIAYQKWMVAAVATGQLSLAAATAHMDNVLQVSATMRRLSPLCPLRLFCRIAAFRQARTEKGRTAALGMHYDEICRREWQAERFVHLERCEHCLFMFISGQEYWSP